MLKLNDCVKTQFVTVKNIIKHYFKLNKSQKNII